MVKKYNVFLRILHWLLAIIIFFMLAMGFYMTNSKSKNRFALYPIHKSVGITVFGLMLVRLLIRYSTKRPPMGSHGALSIILNFFAVLVHLMFYLIIFGMCISGYVMSNASGKKVHWFFDVELPPISAPNKVLANNAHDAHVFLPWILMLLMLLHVGGYIMHSLIYRNNLLKRIA